MRWVFRILGGLVALVVVLAAGLWFFVLRGPDIPYETLEARYGNAASRFVDLPGGFHVHYRDEGDPTKPLIVLVHGFGDNLWSWDGWVARLSDRYHILRIDLPGHGLTRAPEGFVADGDVFAEVVDRFAEALALPPFALAGNSMGGGVAWQVAVRYPARVNAIALLDAAGWPSKSLKDPPLAFKLLRYEWGRAFLRSIDNKPLIVSGLKGEVGDPSVITTEIVERWAEVQRAPGHRAILMSIRPGRLSTATPETLSAIKVPTLVLHGEIDPLIEVEAGRQFAASIPGAEIITYPGIGHLPQIEIPERSAEDFAAFLTRRGLAG